ncbi:ATP12 family chaperone protein [Consotaella salsifontis]|uniref:Chaperone required for the assembly of the F1-ATPase n=1 Tax=Consotaella salsifontis TaxID=1365950 RepID=A0A1T4SYX1_9HYPH|nr:ATP12 family protein [Consotaella salsifontis]SKA33430.1 Chaperone required for the assembly of the F1-ATPase [Consotaella salsifontis]
MTGSTARAELPKRFYTKVDVADCPDGFMVLLDGRPINTPARRRLVVPDRHVADTVAAEWTAQSDVVDPATMPMTRLINTAIDGVAHERERVIADACRYIETDLLFYRAGGPERLVARQTERWNPVVKAYEDDLGVRFVLAEGVMHTPQPTFAVDAVRDRLATFTDSFEVAGFHQMTTLTGSALLALAVAEGRITLDEAWALAHLDEDWTIEHWGADEEAIARRARHFEDMRAAAVLHAAARTRRLKSSV